MLYFWSLGQGLRSEGDVAFSDACPKHLRGGGGEGRRAKVERFARKSLRKKK